MIEDAVKELATLDTLKTRRKSLTDRMDKDYGYFRGDLFEMPKEEGVWEAVTSNRAQSDGWRIINSLGSSMRSIFNEAEKEGRADREKLNFNELLVNGMLFSAERLRAGKPNTPKLQSEAAFYRVVRGWGAYRLEVREDDDNPYLDLAIWDFRNVHYIEGHTGLLKVYNERSISEEQAKEEYEGWEGHAESKDEGMVKIVDVWGFKKGKKKVAQEAVIINKEYFKPPEDVQIGGKTIDYLPIRIKAGGAIPLIMDDNTDNIKKVGESYLVNNRDLLETESRAMTYHVSAAGEEAGEPLILEWDSTKGDMPVEWKAGLRNPRGKKMAFPMDVGKGQKVGELLPQAKGARVQLALGMIQEKLNTGGLNPIAFGQGSSDETAFGVDIRNRNTREAIAPFKDALEEDFVWMAQEITKQFKNGSFSSGKEFSGYNSKAQWFCKKIKEADIDDGKIFKCKLISDELRDKAANVALALQLTEGGLLPKREILDKFQLSDDPDSSIDALAQEQADFAFDTPLIKGFWAKIEDYAKSQGLKEKFELEHAFRKLAMLEMQNQQQMQQATGATQPPTEGGQNPASVSNRVTARRAQPNAPSPVR